MKKKECPSWSTSPGVDEILKSLVLSTQRQNPLLMIDKNFYKNLKPGLGHILFPCMSIIHEQNKKIEIMSSQLESQQTLINITNSMIQRMSNEVQQQAQKITVMSSQLKSIQSLIQKIDEPIMRKDISSPNLAICHNISQDSLSESNSLSSDRPLPGSYNSINIPSSYSHNSEQKREEISLCHPSLKSSKSDYPESHLGNQKSDVRGEPSLKRIKL